MAQIKGILWIAAMVLMAVELVLLIINLVKHRDFKISLILTVLICIMFAVEIVNLCTLSQSQWLQRFANMDDVTFIGLICVAAGGLVYILCYKKGVADITEDDEIDLYEYKRKHDPAYLAKKKQKEEAQKVRNKRKI